MSSVEVSVVSVACLTNDPAFPRLVRAYSDESALSGMPAPKADLVRYQALEDARALEVLAAYHEGILIGFLSLLFAVLPHYGETVCTTESFFVDPDMRSTGAAFALMELSYSRGRARQARGLFISAALGSRLLALLERSETFRESHRVFFRSLS